MPNGGNGDGRNVTMDPINGTRQLRLRFSGGIDPLQETLTRTSEGSIAAKKETKKPPKKWSPSARFSSTWAASWGEDLRHLLSRTCGALLGPCHRAAPRDSSFGSCALFVMACSLGIAFGTDSTVSTRFDRGVPADPTWISSRFHQNFIEIPSRFHQDFIEIETKFLGDSWEILGRFLGEGGRGHGSFQLVGKFFWQREGDARRKTSWTTLDDFDTKINDLDQQRDPFFFEMIQLAFSGHFLAIFRPFSGHFQAIFRPFSGHFQAIFWSIV